jgi:hypothetical protein
VRRSYYEWDGSCFTPRPLSGMARAMSSYVQPACLSVPVHFWRRNHTECIVARPLDYASDRTTKAPDEVSCSRCRCAVLQTCSSEPSNWIRFKLSTAAAQSIRQRQLPQSIQCTWHDTLLVSLAPPLPARLVPPARRWPMPRSASLPPTDDGCMCSNSPCPPQEASAYVGTREPQ